MKVATVISLQDKFQIISKLYFTFYIVEVTYNPKCKLEMLTKAIFVRYKVTVCTFDNFNVACYLKHKLKKYKNTKFAYLETYIPKLVTFQKVQVSLHMRFSLFCMTA